MSVSQSFAPVVTGVTTILVVDDDPDVVWTTTRMLEDAGYAVLSGATAAEALTLILRHRPPIVLLDVELPDGNGVDVARQIKLDPELAGVFVVLVSGSRISPQEQADGLSRGLADGYVLRPFSKVDFLARIEAFLRIRLAEEALKKANVELEIRIAQRTAELREKDQMLLLQSRQAAMGEMISHIAHQWRQPLNLLGLTTQQLLMYYEMGEFDRTFLSENVDRMMKLIHHMSQTIDDFRNYFKPDKEKADFKVQEAIASTLSLLEGSLQDPPISVEVDAKDDSVIFGYPNEFAQVILNIVANAKDVFTERNIDHPKLIIAISREEFFTVVTISDNAGGIPEEILDKVFEPYVSTKGPAHGTGIGLFMSKSIIEKNMGGRLSARNIASGAEFRIEVCHAIEP
jgi:C4-dicarboxylate-specific signal transduction histidine kinase